MIIVDTLDQHKLWDSLTMKEYFWKLIIIFPNSFVLNFYNKHLNMYIVFIPHPEIKNYIDNQMYNI